jgi:MoxR-like ATPase
VTEYDCLLLEHILWQRPEHAPKIADWLLSQLAVDDGMKQVNKLMAYLALPRYSMQHAQRQW